ncbi:putative DNA helicase Pif1 [Helianthus debilis subsp. tardiflorus]
MEVIRENRSLYFVRQRFCHWPVFYQWLAICHCCFGNIQTTQNSALKQCLHSPFQLQIWFKISGLPNHRLVLKVGVPVMLLRNIDQQNGLCNGTRLQIKKIV